MTSPRQPEDGGVFINNLNIHYLDWGGNSDKSLVLLPGLGGSAHTWDYLAQNLCDDFRVYALDQRGHGDSDHARDGYALVKYVFDMAEFAKTLALSKFELMGASLGGRHAIAYAGTYPDTVNHVIIVDIGPEMALSGAKRVNTGLLSIPVAFSSEEEAMDYQRRMSGPAATPERLKYWVKHELRVNWAGKLVFKRDIDISWATGSAGKKEIPMVWDLLSKITCPVLVMRGAESDILSPEIAQRMLSVLPDGHYVEIPNAGHAVGMDNPVAFEAEVRRFLES